MRRHVQRVFGLGGNGRVPPRSLQPARGERRFVRGVNEVVHAARMLRVLLEYALGEGNGVSTSHALGVVRKLSDVAAEHQRE